MMKTGCRRDRHRYVSLVSIFLNEPDRDSCMIAVIGADDNILPAPAYLECCMVLSGRAGEIGLKWLDEFIATRGMQIDPFTQAHRAIARDAFMTYGKGRHLAGLNFGDCMSYAVAKAGGWPLLCAGAGFALTDVAGVAAF